MHFYDKAKSYFFEQIKGKFNARFPNLPDRTASAMRQHWSILKSRHSKRSISVNGSDSHSPIPASSQSNYGYLPAPTPILMPKLPTLNYSNFEDIRVSQHDNNNNR